MIAFSTGNTEDATIAVGVHESGGTRRTPALYLWNDGRLDQVTESYVSQLLTGKKAPPAPERTDMYDKMGAFPRGCLPGSGPHWPMAEPLDPGADDIEDHAVLALTPKSKLL